MQEAQAAARGIIPILIPLRAVFRLHPSRHQEENAQNHSEFPHILASMGLVVSMTIGGQQAEVLYAGAAPGLVAA